MGFLECKKQNHPLSYLYWRSSLYCMATLQVSETRKPIQLSRLLLASYPWHIGDHVYTLMGRGVVVLHYFIFSLRRGWHFLSQWWQQMTTIDNMYWFCTSLRVKSYTILAPMFPSQWLREVAGWGSFFWHDSARGIVWRKRGSWYSREVRSRWSGFGRRSPHWGKCFYRQQTQTGWTQTLKKLTLCVSVKPQT